MNPGDTVSWPHWKIRGPLRSFALTSPAGEHFGSTPAEGNAVADGRILIVDTRPGHKALLDNEGTSCWPALDTDPQPWSVPAGRSVIGLSIVAAGSTAGARLTLRPRYMTHRGLPRLR
ncbi:hypothetical protein RM844_25370 [Streptomyces sp. DSM 44915]|uniref:Uncharacterized protein n=1 Tax=Streptomyces chisholmiae TaxID=3075540 RepID=A0ABU2JZI5_9ACTN|nr:hypothetical protein [Streptomyces sp. DSM 44915]MDT0269618.1 hypothetical protein [Streptomyces sp. DSM 44915]